MNEKCSLRVDTMSLKKTTKNEISKTKTKLPQILSLKSKLFSSKVDSKDKLGGAENRRRTYQQLQFSKKGSSYQSRLYKQKFKNGKEITVIPDTDTEGEGEEHNPINEQKKASMSERFQPKVQLTDIIYLCSDSDNP